MLDLVVGDTDGAGLALGKLGHGWKWISFVFLRCVGGSDYPSRCPQWKHHHQ